MTPLFEYIESHLNTSFEYGKMDCCIFVDGAIQSIGGKSLMVGIKYKSKKGAISKLKKYNGIDGYLDGKAKSIPVTKAKRGDILWTNKDEGALAVCLGDMGAAMTEQGVRYFHVDLFTKAWTWQR